MILQSPKDGQMQLDAFRKRLNSILLLSLQKTEVDHAIELERFENEYSLFRAKHGSDELAVPAKRVTLRCEFMYLVQVEASADLVAGILEKCDIFGYDHPVHWYDMRQDLVRSLRKELRFSEANLLAAESKSEVRRMIKILIATCKGDEAAE